MRRGSAWLLGLVLCGCTVDELAFQGRFCDEEYPCPAGYACQKNRCGEPSPADSEPDKVARDVGPDDAPDIGPGKPDVHRDTGTDGMPVPDGGCPTGLTLCGTSCVDTQTSFFHCSGCNQSCPTGAADRCESGTCHCGHQGAVCSSGLSCHLGACACITGPTSLCQGCCLPGLCMAGNTTGACGLGGVVCDICLATPCTTAACNSGTCSQTDRLDGSLCSGPGTCHGGSCCTGCWDGSACQPGTAGAACGDLGAPCVNCIPQLKLCISGQCG